MLLCFACGLITNAYKYFQLKIKCFTVYALRKYLKHLILPSLKSILRAKLKFKFFINWSGLVWSARAADDYLHAAMNCKDNAAFMQAQFQEPSSLPSINPKRGDDGDINYFRSSFAYFACRAVQ